MTKRLIPLFPFPAIVGQEDLKLGLLLNAINPKIGGVLLKGEKGSVKSTAVRAMCDILPEIEVIDKCPFSLSPSEAKIFCPICNLCNEKKHVIKRNVKIVTLPLNATEDMIIGGIDFEKTVQSGKKCISPGIFAKVHQGILYIDEVNLLDDHLIDIILSVAESKVNIIEREGISFRHPSNFILIGTMNPEEGEIRPHFLDRFGFCINITGEKDKEKRALIMRRKIEFDTNYQRFYTEYSKEILNIKKQIVQAKKLLSNVRISSKLRALIAQMCIQSNVPGHRADIIIEQGAKAMAALLGHREVREEDILKIAPFVLSHRQRDISSPPSNNKEKGEKERETHHAQKPMDKKGKKDFSNKNLSKNRHKSHNSSNTHTSENKEDESKSQGSINTQVVEKIFDIGETFKVKPFSVPKDTKFRRGSGRRSISRIIGFQGRYVKNRFPKGVQDVALDATLRAAAPYQKYRKKTCAVVIEPQDIRQKIRERKIGNFLLFLVDASGSMGAQARMETTKGAIMSLLLDAYQRRDKVAMVKFNKKDANVILPPTSSVEMAAKFLAKLPVGGKTPLSAGLLKAQQLLRSQFIRDPNLRPLVILITDGRCNVSLYKDKPVEECLRICHHLGRNKQVKYIVIDTEKKGLISFGLAYKIARALGGIYVKIEDLKTDTLIELVKNNFVMEERR